MLPTFIVIQIQSISLYWISQLKRVSIESVVADKVYSQPHAHARGKPMRCRINGFGIFWDQDELSATRLVDQEACVRYTREARLTC